MAVPRRKTSPSRRGMRRSADALKAPTYIEDKDSGERRRPHHIDLKTGMYKGRQVLTPRTEACHRGRPGRHRVLLARRSSYHGNDTAQAEFAVVSVRVPVADR